MVYMAVGNDKKENQNQREKFVAYCAKHPEEKLVGFSDYTTLCLMCVEEVAAQKKLEEQKIVEDIEQVLSPEETQKLLAWAADLAARTGFSENECILRAAIMKAMRCEETVENFVKNIIEKRTVLSLLKNGG